MQIGVLHQYCTENATYYTFLEQFVLSRRCMRKSLHWSQTKTHLLSTVITQILQTGILNVTWFILGMHQFDSASR